MQPDEHRALYNDISRRNQKGMRTEQRFRPSFVRQTARQQAYADDERGEGKKPEEEKGHGRAGKIEERSRPPATRQ